MIFSKKEHAIIKKKCNKMLVMQWKLFVLSFILIMAIASCNTGGARKEQLDYSVKLDVVTHHWDGEFNWSQARVAAIPKMGENGQPRLIITMQKWFVAHSDFYSGLYTMRSDDLGVTWTKPVEQSALSWRYGKDSVIIGICDFTPGWHAKSKKLIGIGHTVFYKAGGEELVKNRMRSTAYAVYDPEKDQWKPWQQLEMPDKHKFYNSGSGCGQWLEKADGTLLIPAYFKAEDDTTGCYSSTILHCSFDGEKLTFIEHGDILSWDVPRGVYEPSLTYYRGKFYLTLRNDIKAYVTVSDDAMQWKPVKPWVFEDGSEIGSYNTQQHWVTHSNELFLVYTRRDTSNQDIPRSRAPLFMSQVDTDKLILRKKTERIVIPERGVMMGNFGTANITGKESWIMVGENMYPPENLDRGANGSVFAARIIWSKTNKMTNMPE